MEYNKHSVLLHGLLLVSHVHCNWNRTLIWKQNLHLHFKAWAVRSQGRRLGGALGARVPPPHVGQKVRFLKV